jgi:sugar phosphate permease
LALVAAGWFVTSLQSSVSTLVQSEVAGEMRGRIGSLLGTALTSANVVSMAVAGVVAAAIGVQGVFVAPGMVAVGAALLTTALFRAASAPAIARP